MYAARVLTCWCCEAALHVLLMQVPCDSISAGAASTDGLDVYWHDVSADQLAADGRHFCQRVLHQVWSKRRTSMLYRIVRLVFGTYFSCSCWIADARAFWFLLYWCVTLQQWCTKSSPLGENSRRDFLGAYLSHVNVECWYLNFVNLFIDLLIH